MKLSIIFLILCISFVFGWSLAIYYTDKQKTTQLPYISGSWSTTIQSAKTLPEEKVDFATFIKKLEEKYIGSSSLDSDRFAQYLQEVVHYIYIHPELLKVVILPNKELDENLNLIIDQIKWGKTNNYSAVSLLIDHINSIGVPPQQVTKEACKTFLEWQKDLGSYLQDLSGLLYSKYRSSPFFQRELQSADTLLLDNTKNANNSNDSISSQLNQRIISDMLFFSRVKSMDLSGIADAISCEYSNPNDKPMCENLKTALRDGNKEFILKKFSDNQRKYDLDSFYIRYLIGDLDKSGLIDKLCLIQ
jgi:hypothetical protein